MCSKRAKKYLINFTFLFLALILNINVNCSNLRLLENNDQISTSASAAKTFTSSQTLDSPSYSTNTADTSIILVKSPAVLQINGGTLSKTGGDCSNTEKSDFYGINAGVLVTTGSSCIIDGAKIVTNAKGSNAIFATGTNAKVTVNNTVIETQGSSSSRGLHATYGGTINGENVKIKTTGGSCATLATDRGEGTVTCDSCTLETNGAGSPVIYSTGSITITNSTGTANGAQFVVVEGKNSATVKNSEMFATGKGNRGTVDVCGVMVYQSMSGDAGVGKGSFTCSDSNLTIVENSDYYSSAPFFFVTNTQAEISLTNCTMNYGSGVLVDIQGTSAWGRSGSNGGILNLTISGQIARGNIIVDNISNITLILKNQATYEGTINSKNNASAVAIIIDSTSSWKLTGNSFISSLDNKGTLDENNYKVSYFNATNATSGSGGNGTFPPDKPGEGGDIPPDKPGEGGNPPDKPDGETSTFMVILICIGVIIILLLIVLIVISIKKKKAQQIDFDKPTDNKPLFEQ